MAEAKAAAKPAEEKEKMVTIRLPRDKEHKDDVFVSVNLRNWLIQRGVEVKVPECVAEVLRHQEEMLDESMMYDEKVRRGD